MRTACFAAATVLFIAAAVLLAILMSLINADSKVEAQEKEQLNEQIESVKQQQNTNAQSRKELTAALDKAQKSTDQLIAALKVAQKQVDIQKDTHMSAQQATSAIETRLKWIQKDINAYETDLATLRDELQESTIEAYIQFQSPSDIGLFGNNPWKNARAATLTEFATAQRRNDIDDLRRATSTLQQLKDSAEQVAIEYQQYETELSGQLTRLNSALASEAALTAQAEEKLDSLLYESQFLKQLDAELSAELLQLTRRLADLLERERIKRERINSVNSVNSVGTSTREKGTSTREQSNAAGTRTELKLVSVRGIVVAEDIADSTRALLSAMEAAGFKLGGGGYRSNASQIYLRKAHCGTSQYAIWEMPASRCRPPTARPGRSDHEQGRAIDFTYKGNIISNRDSAVFKALQRLAPRYGFTNLPSEPWHWSNT